MGATKSSRTRLFCNFLEFANCWLHVIYVAGIGRRPTFGHNEQKSDDAHINVAKQIDNLFCPGFLDDWIENGIETSGHTLDRAI